MVCGDPAVYNGDLLSEQQHPFLFILFLYRSICPLYICWFVSLSMPLALHIATFVCDGTVISVWTHFTLRDEVVTGDTVGTLGKVMHLSVSLIPCFKFRFPPCSLVPYTGTRTHRCGLWHILPTHTPTLKHDEFRSDKCNKVSLVVLCVCVCVRRSVVSLFWVFPYRYIGIHINFPLPTSIPPRIESTTQTLAFWTSITSLQFDWLIDWKLKTLLEIQCPFIYIPTRFRMRQVNIVGFSPLSAPSRLIQTLQAAPDMYPSNLTLLAATQISLSFSWKVVNTHLSPFTCVYTLYHHNSIKYWGFSVSCVSALHLSLCIVFLCVQIDVCLYCIYKFTVTRSRNVQVWSLTSLPLLTLICHIFDFRH